MVKKIAMAVGVLVAGVLGYAATRPDTFRVERTATVKAPSDRIYPLIQDFLTLAPAAGGTAVTWAMQGENRLVGKLISVFMSMDRMIGDQFETGLANLKALAEKA